MCNALKNREWLRGLVASAVATVAVLLSNTPMFARYDGGDMNLYRYVNNNPTNNGDPTGLIIREAICKCPVLDCNDKAVTDFYGVGGEESVIVASPPTTSATACRALGETCYFVRWGALTTDQGTVAALCKTLKCPGCTVARCEKDLAYLMDMVRHIEVFPFWIDRCEAWALECENTIPWTFDTGNPCIKSAQILRFSLTGKWPSTGHVALEVVMCDGTKFYVDIGTWGGDDRIFFPEDIPDYGTPDRK